LSQPQGFRALPHLVVSHLIPKHGINLGLKPLLEVYPDKTNPAAMSSKMLSPGEDLQPFAK
jgi:hypothetical protein